MIIVHKSDAPDSRIVRHIPSQRIIERLSRFFSQGFNYPPEAGYALDPHTGPRYYMLETHYTNPQMDAFISDSSGLRLHYTDKLRTHDAGILSVGIDPNWRHIIPPGQPDVISEGHCISDCTGHTIPNSGINIFAVIMHTHQLGRKVRLRQIRSGEELPPIASDTNYDPSYQEYRKLQKPVRVYPVSVCFSLVIIDQVDGRVSARCFFRRDLSSDPRSRYDKILLEVIGK